MGDMLIKRNLHFSKRESLHDSLRIMYLQRDKGSTHNRDSCVADPPIIMAFLFDRVRSTRFAQNIFTYGYYLAKLNNFSVFMGIIARNVAHYPCVKADWTK